MAGEKSSPTEKPSPPKASVVTEGAPKAGAVVEGAEKAKPAEVADKKKNETEDPKKSEKTDIFITKEALEASKGDLRKKQEQVERAKSEQEAEGSLRELNDGGVVSDEKEPKNTVLKASEEALKEQENKTAEAIKGKMDAELESVTRNGNIHQLNPEDQKKIRTEVVRTSIDPNLLPRDTKEAILKTMKGVDGKPLLDMQNVDLENLTQYQKEYILNSERISEMSTNAVLEYKKLYTEAQKTGKEIDPELLKGLQKQFGLPSADALELLQLKGSKLTEYPSNSQIGIVQRVLSESTFRELENTLKDGMKWGHVPDKVKREIAINSFTAESDRNTPEIRQAILDARSELARAAYDLNSKEPANERADRLKLKTGITESSTDIEGLSLEARKSGLSPGMRALCDFFGPIGAALGMPFWQEYMGEGSSEDETADTSDRYSAGDGNNEYTGAVGEQSPELAKNGFKGDVMNSIWRWEYQPGHEAEVVPAGKSGLTLCGGIDLAYTPYDKVQTIFQGILSPQTIEKIRPFCDNGRRGPIRSMAETLLSSTPGLKAEIEGQLNYSNMGEAFTRSLTIDWERLVKKHGEVVKKAPGYIQVFMLSRFYHAGIGGSASIIRDIIASGFNHSSVVSIAEKFGNTRSEGYYKNRMNKEIAYLKSKPGDATPPVASVAKDGQHAEMGQDQAAVQWFQDNAGKPYGEGDGKFDCMTSTHAALGLDYTRQYARAFNGKFIDKKDKNKNLWNVAMASALYVGNISSANSDAQDGIIQKKPDGYYGEKSGDTTNMEYYIEENVMKRVNDSPDGMVDVANSGKLIHYSKSKKGVFGIIDDIKNRLKPGESAMMGATGEGTNKGGHEWLVYNNNGTFKAYDSTNAGGQGVSGTGMELSSFLNDSRRAQYPNEAIIFAKKPGVARVSQNIADAQGKKIDVFETPEKIGFIGDSHLLSALGNKAPLTVLSGGNMMEGKKLSVYDRVDQVGRTYIGNKENVVICLGTNDAANSPTPLQMVTNMQKLVSLVREINPNCKILIVTPPRNGNLNINNKIAEYSANLSGTSLGPNITVGDFYTESKNQNLVLNDGIHLKSYKPMKDFINSLV